MAWRKAAKAAKRRATTKMPATNRIPIMSGLWRGPTGLDADWGCVPVCGPVPRTRPGSCRTGPGWSAGCLDARRGSRPAGYRWPRAAAPPRHAQRSIYLHCSQRPGLWTRGIIQGSFVQITAKLGMHLLASRLTLCGPRYPHTSQDTRTCNTTPVLFKKLLLKYFSHPSFHHISHPQ